ncbi:hypothetical protein HDE_11199 [Halotydeus destructor]|nr:hypothetical protein HDE_11199 [Halotydeus destructor]
MASNQFDGQIRCESLAGLPDNVIDSILCFIPSFWLKLQIKNTNRNLNRLVQEHFKKLKVVDFRNPFQDKKTKMAALCTKWFSGSLTKITVEQEYCEYVRKQLQATHPQLYPDIGNIVFDDEAADAIGHVDHETLIMKA